jgi:hypothetical protein
MPSDALTHGLRRIGLGTLTAIARMGYAAAFLSP